MKTITTQSNDAIAETAKTINWQVEHNRLRIRYLDLQRAFAELQSNPRSSQQSESNFAAVRRFVSEMSASEGIVVCANIYNQAWFDQDADSVYAKKLAYFFVDSFASAISLAEPTYRTWQHIATGSAKL